jgi:small-conductance mechanosensitive channel
MLLRTSSSDSRFAQTLSTRKAVAPLWLWPNFLSLDAPLVALAWAFLFAQSEHESLRWSVAAVLAGTVWTIYAADRLLDARRRGANLRQRHFFSRDNGKPLLLAVIPATGLTFFFALRSLSPAEFTAGIFLAVAVLIYLLAVHTKSATRRPLPKELFVGLIFASGVTLPVWAVSPQDIPRLTISVGLFAALCTLNCLAIETWESTTDVQQSQPQTRWLEAHFVSVSTGLAILACATEFLPITLRPRTELSFAIALASVLTLLLHSTRNGNSTAALRVLADVALLIAALVALTLPALLHS